ncbi:hypothetical protein ACFL0V_05840, partial [Nanoarchaeota archaeon]
VNDAWYGALTNIKENSQDDAIINSWWDFGHWFKYLADRRVSLDGGTQAGPPLHWLGKLMTTDDEKHSIGILRMLDCGSNNAFVELDKSVKDTAKSVTILDKIVTQDKEEAERTLSRIGLNSEQVASVVQYTHCDAPEDFFITSEDMVGKAGVWGHFGSWDFGRAEMYYRVKGVSLAEGKQILIEDKFNLTETEAEKMYFDIQTADGNQWITPWPGYIAGVKGCEGPTDGTISCLHNVGGQQMLFEVDLETMDVMIPASVDNVKPTSIVYPTKIGTKERKFEGTTVGLSLVLIPNGAGFNSMVVHPLLANSMFTRMFYMEGHGLKYYDRFDDRRQVTGGRIIVWKADWEGTDANEPFTATEPASEDPEVAAIEGEIDSSIEELEELTEMSEVEDVVDDMEL